MAKYSAIAMEHFCTPRNHGPLEDHDYEGNARLPGQTPFMRIYLRLKDETIEQASFVTFGCAAAIASGSVLTEMITGISVAACRDVDQQALEMVLGGLPDERRFCLGLAIDALRNALEQV